MLGVQSIGERLSNAHYPSSPRVRERELLRFAAELIASDVQSAASDVRSCVLNWVTSQVGGTLPDIAWHGKSFEHLPGGRTCIGTAFADSERVFWSIRVDRPDTGVAQRVWTTEIVVGYVPQRSGVFFGLRLLVSTPEVFLDVKPAVPKVLRDVIDRYEIKQNGGVVKKYVWRVSGGTEAEGLIEDLLNPNRKLPYVVCSMEEGESKSRLDINRLAKSVFGIAKVVLVDGEVSWLLTRRFGKGLSVYGGAVRVYLPGFSYDSNPYHHRLLLIGEGRRGKEFADSSVRRIVASESLRQLSLGVDVVAFSDVRSVALDIERERLAQLDSEDAKKLEAAHRQIAALKDDLRRAEETQQWLSDEHQAIESRASELERKLNYAEVRNEQLLHQLQESGAKPDASISLPGSWDGFADWCDKFLHGRVVLSGPARKETKDPKFEDVDVAARCLLWLANDYRTSRLEGRGRDFQKEPVLDGIRNERCGADSFDVEWQKSRWRVEWHIKNGGNTRDPRRCLRIYYFWNDEDKIVVVANMPSHRRTGAT